MHLAKAAFVYPTYDTGIFPIIARKQNMLKRLFHFHSSTGDISRPILCLSIGEEHVGVALCRSHNSELLHVSYFAGEVNAETLAGIFLDNAELNREYEAVKVCFQYGRNMLVPLAYFQSGTEQKMLAAAHGHAPETKSLSDHVTAWQLHNVYSVPTEIIDWLQRKFPLYKHLHHLTLGITSMSAEATDTLLLDIHTNEFSLIAVKENKLLLAQTHAYSTFDDILYFLLKAGEQFSLPQETAQLLVSGLVEKDSQLSREMHHYFINVQFRDSEWQTAGNDDDRYPAHYFTMLNDLAKCEL